VIAKIIFFPSAGLLNILMYTEVWASAYLSIIITLTFFIFRPNEILHPNNVLFAFYGLYIILPSNLNLVFNLIDWEYVLPWVQEVSWNEISKQVLYQAEFTFFILFFGFRYFSIEKTSQIINVHIKVFINKKAVYVLSVLNLILIIWFFESTAGIKSWITDYSQTYLSKREGHGLLNFITITLGNVLAFILGYWTLRTSEKKIVPILIAVLVLGLQSYMNGFKGRFILLLVLFLSPWLYLLRLRLTTLFTAICLFFGLLYTTTLVRTEGFYTELSFFLEMLIGYFNSYQLHDLIVTSRSPDFFQTVWQIFVKPLQTLGFMGAEADFDISVMLTKEFFPDQWYLEKATQQWPLDTELYLNYYSMYFSWIPLTIYTFLLSKIFRAAVLRQNIWLLPVYTLEFLRIFAVMRGTLIPWEIFVMVVQYPVIYLIARKCISVSATENGNVEGQLELDHVRR
jgi:hypothetical protein